jgi:hypothetical protein
MGMMHVSGAWPSTPLDVVASTSKRFKMEFESVVSADGLELNEPIAKEKTAGGAGGLGAPGKASAGRTALVEPRNEGDSKFVDALGERVQRSPGGASATKLLSRSRRMA